MTSHDLTSAIISLVYTAGWPKSRYTAPPLPPTCSLCHRLLAATILPASYPMTHTRATAYRPRIHLRMMPGTPHNRIRALPTGLQAAAGTTGGNETDCLCPYPCPSPRRGNRRKLHSWHKGCHIPRKVRADRTLPISRNHDQTSFCLFRMAYPSPPHDNIRRRKCAKLLHLTLRSISLFSKRLLLIPIAKH
jgi:hypothetical protein